MSSWYEQSTWRPHNGEGEGPLALYLCTSTSTIASQIQPTCSMQHTPLCRTETTMHAHT